MMFFKKKLISLCTVNSVYSFDLFNSFGKVRHCLFMSGVFLVTLFSANVHADIYFDSKQSIQENTDALVDVLENSVVPGGVRSVELNGSKLNVRRFANPGGDNSEFYNVWIQAAKKKAEANNKMFSILEEHDPIYAAFTEEVPYTSLLKDLDNLIGIGEDFAEKQANKLKELTINALETPFSYETSQHRVIASVPVKTIDPESSLVSEVPGNGYLFLSEKIPGSTVSSAFWQMEFGEGFIFSDLFGKAGEDVKGQDSRIARYPGSRMTMNFSEDADGWYSQTWSYESTGDILSHVSHYIRAFEVAGFGKESHSVVESKQGLVQFSSQSREATLFVELVDPHVQSVQVTLQVRSN